MSEDSEDTKVQVEPEPRITVEYCPNCSLPFEYCEYSANFEACAKHLESVDPDLLKQLRELRVSRTGGDKHDTKEAKSDGPAESKEKAEDEEDDEEDGDEGGEDEGDASAAPAVSAKSSGGPKEIHIQVRERTRHKSTTIIKNIDKFGLKEKDIAKLLSKKFAASASCTGEGIQVNGDIGREVAEYLIDQFPDVFTEDDFFTMNKAGKKCHLF